MRLSEFIASHKEQILSEWESFARTLLPAAHAMDMGELRDHAGGILDGIVRDLGNPQTSEQQARKSKGKSDALSADRHEASEHGAVRAGHGFTLAQMVSEFRALRASILRLWHEAAGAAVNVEEMTRFNEAIDQALAHSSNRFLEDLDHSKDLFLGILGHDLRNPLGAIMMSASQMLRQAEADSPYNKAASRIMRSSIRMREIISDLLDFTRTRLGTGMPIACHEVDVAEICRDTLEEVSVVFPGTDLRLDLQGDLNALLDAPRIAQALSNLLGNAVQHGAKDAPITLSARGEGSQLLLTVHNWGPAIPRGELGQIFLPLTQAAPDQSDTAHLGLGLYIAREIVAAHGGNIEVDSSPERGTAFQIRLPRSARDSAAAAH